MFGMGFTEILFVAVIAIIFLGPEKLPEAMVKIAKFINSFRQTVTDAKTTFENEINITQLKAEANAYKSSISGVGDDISGFKNSLSNPIDDLNEALAGLNSDPIESDEVDSAFKSKRIDKKPKDEKSKDDKIKSKNKSPKKKKKNKIEDES